MCPNAMEYLKRLANTGFLVPRTSFLFTLHWFTQNTVKKNLKLVKDISGPVNFMLTLSQIFGKKCIRWLQKFSYVHVRCTLCLTLNSFYEQSGQFDTFLISCSYFNLVLCVWMCVHTCVCVLMCIRERPCVFHIWISIWKQAQHQAQLFLLQ